MEWVLAHMEDSDFNEPLPDPAAAAAADGGISGGSQGVGSAAAGAKPEAVAQLAAMGFNDAQAGAALQVGISEHRNRQYTDACGCAVPCQAACRTPRMFLVWQLAAGSWLLTLEQLYGVMGRHAQAQHETLAHQVDKVSMSSFWGRRRAAAASSGRQTGCSAMQTTLTALLPACSQKPAAQQVPCLTALHACFSLQGLQWRSSHT